MASRTNPALPAAPVVITGSRGRIASHLAETLQKAGLGVIRVSRRRGDGHISYEDLLSSDRLTNSSALIHCAWSSLPATAESAPEAVNTEDLPLLGRLLDAAAARPDPASLQFIFLSSGGAVYGECERAAVETDPLAPVGWYGRGKVAAEELLASRSGETSPTTCILRPSNLFGIRHAPDKPQGIVGAALHAARTGEPLKLYGGGASLKDFLPIADFEAAVLECLRLRLAGTYNICSGHSMRVLDLITLVEELGHRQIPRTFVPEVSWDVHRSMLSPAKFTRTANWNPPPDLRSGLLDALREAELKNASG